MNFSIFLNWTSWFISVSNRNTLVFVANIWTDSLGRSSRPSLEGHKLLLIHRSTKSSPDKEECRVVIVTRWVTKLNTLTFLFLFYRMQVWITWQHDVQRVPVFQKIYFNILLIFSNNFFWPSAVFPYSYISEPTWQQRIMLCSFNVVSVSARVNKELTHDVAQTPAPPAIRRAAKKNQLISRFINYYTFCS